MVKIKTQEPHYTLLKSEGPIEIREYSELVVAEVQIDGARYSAINSGFRILADYIFGNNKISQKIAMTAPVIQQRIKNLNDSESSPKNEGNWKILFLMPEQFRLNELPRPNDQRIVLSEMAPKKYAVIRFSGMNTQANLAKHEAILNEYLLNNELKSNDQPIYAFYNPPWILPFLRRNEILISID